MDAKEIKETITKLAELDSVEYNQERKAASKKTGLRVSVLDKEIKKLQQCKVQDNLLENLEPTPEVDTSVFKLVTDIIKRHVILDPEQVAAITLWILNSYVYDKFPVCPFLAITSPVKRCGKSKLLTVLDGLCYKGLMIGNATAATLFRIGEEWQPTLLLDESDTFLPEQESMRGILDGSHIKVSARVPRCDGPDNNIRMFNTWYPKAIAAIGSLSDTVMDRSINIRMKRKLVLNETVKIPLTFKEDCLMIRKNLLAWANKFEAVEVKAPADIKDNDRAIDNWLPLRTIAQTFGWDDRTTQAMMAIENGKLPDENSVDMTMLADIAEIVKLYFDSAKKISLAQIVDQLHKLPDGPYNKWGHRRQPIGPRSVTPVMISFGVTPHKERVDGRVKRNICYYILNLKSIFNRYLVP